MRMGPSSRLATCRPLPSARRVAPEPRRRVHTPAASAPRAGDEADDGDEEGGPDDRPQDGEALAPDAHREELGQAEQAGEPQSHESADEAQGDGDQATTAGHACDGLTEGTAHP